MVHTRGYVNGQTTGLHLLTVRDVTFSNLLGESLHFISMVWFLPHRTLTWWQEWYCMHVLMLATYQSDLTAYDCRGISSLLWRPVCHCKRKNRHFIFGRLWIKLRGLKVMFPCSQGWMCEMWDSFVTHSKSYVTILAPYGPLCGLCIMRPTWTLFTVTPLRSIWLQPDVRHFSQRHFTYRNWPLVPMDWLWDNGPLGTDT